MSEIKIKRLVFTLADGQQIFVTVTHHDPVHGTWRWQSYRFGGREAVTVSGPSFEPEDDGTMWVADGTIYLDHPLFKTPHTYDRIISGFTSSL